MDMKKERMKYMIKYGNEDKPIQDIKEKKQKQQKGYYQRPEVKARKKEYSNKPLVKKKIKEYSFKSALKKYGLTTEDYNKLVEQQNNKCAICGNNETIKQNGKTKRLSIDHCHKTGKVRELLCGRCNLVLGNLKDDPSLFKKCIKYLEKHSS